MFLSRLFRRRNRSTPDPPVPSDTRVVVEVIRPGTQPRNTNAGRRGAVFFFDEDNLVRADSHYRLIDLLSRPRVIATSSERVSTAVRLVDALRRLELEGGPMGRDSGPMSLFIALALRELDLLVDAMTYEELWDAFGGRGELGLGESDIKAIPTRSLSVEQASHLCGEGAACSVCLEQFCAHEVLRDLPGCSHSFHVQCIDPWLRKKNACPVCRRNAVGSASAS